MQWPAVFLIQHFYFFNRENNSWCSRLHARTEWIYLISAVAECRIFSNCIFSFLLHVLQLPMKANNKDKCSNRTLVLFSFGRKDPNWLPADCSAAFLLPENFTLIISVIFLLMISGSISPSNIGVKHSSRLEVVKYFSLDIDDLILLL